MLKNRNFSPVLTQACPCLGTQNLLHPPEPKYPPWVWHCGLCTRVPCPSPDTGQQGMATVWGPNISLRSEPAREGDSWLWIEADGEVLSPGSMLLRESAAQLSHSLPWLLPPWERLPHRMRDGAGSHEPSRCVQAPRLLHRQKHLVAHLGEEKGVCDVGKTSSQIPTCEITVRKKKSNKKHL